MSESKETIIVAEDSAPNRKILVHLLEKLEYNVIGCANGQEAWDQLASGNHANVVAIISDIMMPHLDGLKLLKRVREDAKYKDLPFVLVTAVVDRDYILEAKTNNVNGYILKPVTFDRVTTKLKELFPSKVLPRLAG